MNRPRVLSAFFPTTTMMVDDSEAFLSNLCLMLDRTKNYDLMTTPIEALEKIRLSFDPRLLLQSLNSGSSVDSEEHELREEMIFSALKLLSESESRHEAISVIVVDFSMPEMDGLEFCRKLSEHPAKKIMLTGEADLNTAVQAFNEGVIDRFFVKGTENLFSKIDAEITQLQIKYFEEFCQEIYLKLERVCSMNILSDPKYQSLFNNVRLKKKPAEYYLVDETGSFLFVDSRGVRSWLAINTEKDLQKYYDIAKDNEAPGDVCHLMSSKKSVLFSPRGDLKKMPTDQWQRFIYPAEHASGSPYIYSVIE